MDVTALVGTYLTWLTNLEALLALNKVPLLTRTKGRKLM
jgi:hypothetical protein